VGGFLSLSRGSGRRRGVSYLRVIRGGDGVASERSAWLDLSRTSAALTADEVDFAEKFPNYSVDTALPNSIVIVSFCSV